MHHQPAIPAQPMPPHQAPQHFQHPHAVAPQPMGMPPGSHGPVPQITHAYMSEQGRASMPPAFSAEPSQERTVPVSESSQDHTSNTLKPENSQSPPQRKSLSKSRSIFTPIDDRGSVLARHFGAGAPVYESPRRDHASSAQPPQEELPGPKIPPMSAATEPARAQSTSSAPDIKPPSRTNSGALTTKRPQLKVQIPSESSDHGSATAESSDHDSGGNKTVTSAKGSDNPPTGVVLPPPSPSAGAILSAGAQGPPNPFARPPPPGVATQGNGFGGSTTNTNNSGNNSNNIETPISALPSRFVSDALLPSPSSFFPEWGFGRSGPDSNLLPSPLTFPTPAVQTGPSFSRDDEQDKKRKSPEGGPAADGANKKPKT